MVGMDSVLYCTDKSLVFSWCLLVKNRLDMKFYDDVNSYKKLSNLILGKSELREVSMWKNAY